MYIFNYIYTLLCLQHSESSRQEIRGSARVFIWSLHEGTNPKLIPGDEAVVTSQQSFAVKHLGSKRTDNSQWNRLWTRGFLMLSFFSCNLYIYIIYILVKILNASKCKLNSFDRSIVVKKNALVNTHCTGCWVKLICRLNISFCLLGVPLAEGHADGLGRPHQPYGQPSSENMWKSFHIKLVKDALHLKQN